ncbi:siroheme synthase CysG [Donghicola sp. XS_ASV15]|uniref:siroheme synthase CysG n=1 Tax=Donghicola sp. XS_ASV15 TaxID=3241295 RepID=UPI003513F305
MKSFPMFLTMAERRVVIVGGDEQAAQKSRLILKTEAEIVLAAPELEPELAALVADGRASHYDGPITPDLFRGAALVFIGSGCPGIDASIHAIAKEAGVVVNVVDQPHLCDATTPSLVDRDPVVVAIGTEGTAPVLGRQIKTQIETMLDPRLGGFAALAGRLRDAVAFRVPKEARREFWRRTFSGAAWDKHRSGAEREAAQMLKAEIEAGGIPEPTVGSIALVGAGPGARDLLTMRAVARLQEADIIYYDRLVDPEVLELARRDSERVFVGKEVGAHSWPQDKINQVIVASAKQGKKVVRLKSGDPSLFGRSTEEMAAAETAGIEVEIVPGVTSASAAAASINRALTERGQTDHVVFSTGTCRPGAPNPDWGRMLNEGATLALYMAVARADEIAETLVRNGAPVDCTVEIVTRASHSDEKIWKTTLGDLARTVAEDGVENPAIIMVRRPKLTAPAFRCAKG